MALPNNVLQTVQTYQESSLAFLLNLNCFIHTANTKFKDFDKIEANLGSTVGFDLPPRYVANDTLVAIFQESTQRVHTLTVDQAKNVSYSFSNQQFIFNGREYMEKFGKGAVYELSAAVESNVALNAETQPYRFYGDGSTAINSYTQLSQMLANFRNYGSPTQDLKVYLPDVAVPAIVGSGLNQFVLDRNEDAAMSWMIGDWSGAKFYRSNLLPVHTAGSLGIAGTTLTVVSTNDATGANITQITFSGAGTSPTAALLHDSLQFSDGVSGQTDVRFMTFIGHKQSAQPCQVRITADAASSAGSLTVNITPALNAVAGSPTQNINTNIVAGMEATILPSHRCGLVVGGDGLFLAMPRLPEEVPFPTANKSDPDSGVSMRAYYGSLFAQNQRGFVNDVIWGSTLVPEYSMKIAFPLE